jgi:hypothetical protein
MGMGPLTYGLSTPLCGCGSVVLAPRETTAMHIAIALPKLRAAAILPSIEIARV